MPRLSDEMEAGTIVRWLRADGDQIVSGEDLVEIETDKAATIHPSSATGALTIVAREGETVAVGSPIAQVTDAQKLEDRPDDAAAEPREAGTAKGEVTVTEPTRAQQQTARRVAESRAIVPAVTLRATIDMQACAELRAGLAASASEVVPSYDDLVIKACATALAAHTSVNGGYRDGKFESHSRINVGFVVADAKSLITPTIFDADRKRLGQIADETRTLTERSRSGEITPPELAGGTFTVSSLGDFGVRSFEAIISPSQAAILAVGAVEQRPAARDGAVVLREQMDVELSCDHRILHGAQAAAFLALVRELLEEPLRMTL